MNDFEVVNHGRWALRRFVEHLREDAQDREMNEEELRVAVEVRADELEALAGYFWIAFGRWEPGPGPCVKSKEDGFFVRPWEMYGRDVGTRRR